MNVRFSQYSRVIAAMCMLVIGLGISAFLLWQSNSSDTYAIATTITQVDTTGDVGLNSSIAIDTFPGAPDNFPRISYFDQTNNDLKYVLCGNAACSSGNTITTIDSSGTVGLYTSIAIDPTDHFPRISYISVTGFVLKFVKCPNLACTGATPISLGSADNNFTSLALDTSGFPRITFKQGGFLNIIQCTNADCTAGATPVVLDNTAAVVGAFSSIKVGTDNLSRIAYQDQTNGDLKFIKCATSTCTTSETKTTLDTTNLTGYFASLGLSGANLPRISYWDGTSQQFKYIECTNDSCTSTTGPVVLDTATTGNTNVFGALALGTDGFPNIVYSSQQDLKFVHCGDTSCSSKNVLYLDSALNVGQDSAIAMGADNFPRISYRDNTLSDLKYIQCADATCGTIPSAPTSLLINTQNNTAQTQFSTSAGGRLTLTSKELVVSAVNSEPDGDSVNKYQIQVATDNAFSSVIYDSGSAGTSMTTLANGAQSADIEVPAPIIEDTTYYWRIRFWDIAGNAGDFSPSGGSAASFKTNAGLTPVVNNIDSTGSVGEYTSIAIYSGDNFARISYYDSTNGDLKFKKCTNADCTTAVTTTVDSTGTVGQHTAIAVNSSGLARIVYYDATPGGPFGPAGDVKYVECTNADCTTNNITTIATTNDVGQYASIALTSVGDGEKASISYYNTNTGFPAGPGDLMFVRCPNTACTGSTPINLDTTGNTGSYTSIKLSTEVATLDYPRITFYDATNGDLKFTQCTAIDCATKNTVTVASTGDVGQHTSLALGTGDIPHISYYDVTNGDVKYIKCSDAACSGGTPVTIDSTGNVGFYTSIDLHSSNGNPSIAYYDLTNSAVKFATCTDNTCSSVTVNTVNKVGGVGRYISMALGTDDNFARISYHDTSTIDLKFARCTNVGCSQVTVVNTAPAVSTALYSNTSTNGAQTADCAPTAGKPNCINPLNLESTSVVFSAVHTDADSDAANKYQLQIDNDDDFSSVLYDSGSAGTSMTSTASGARSPNISILAHGGAVTNLFSGGVPSTNTPYYWRIKFWDVNGDAGSYTGSGLSAAYFMVATVNCTAAASGLVSWWPGDTNAADAFGSNNGVLKNGTTLVSAKVLRGFSFDGIDDYVDVGVGTYLDGSTQMTLSTWVKSNNYGSATAFIYNYNNTVANGWVLQAVNGKLRFGTLGTYVDSTNSIPTSQFVHVVGVYDGSFLKVYINGVLEGSAAASGTISDAGNTLNLGRWPAGGQYLSGILDEPMMFNRALSPSEVNAMYTNGSIGVCKSENSLSVLKDTLTRQQISTATNHTILFTTPSGVTEDSTVTLTFPSGFNLSTITENDIDVQDDGVELTTAPDCSGSEKVGIGVSGQVVTITVCNGDGGSIAKNSVITTKIGTNATQSGTGANQITNPSTAGEYVLAIGGTFGDSGSLAIPILDSDRVTEAATITPFITFDIDTGISAGETLPPYTVFLGNLSSASVSSSNHSTINSIYLDLNTNAYAGAIVTVKGLNGGLKSTIINSTFTTTDSGSAVALSAGTEGFGICIANTSAVAGTITKTAPYNGSCDSTTHNIGGVTTSPRTLFTSAGSPLDGTDNNTAEIMLKTAISPTTKAAEDYTEVLTFIATGSF